MTIIQRYKSIPVLGSDPGDGLDQYRRIERSALVKKALMTVYGHERTCENPQGTLALLLSDILFFTRQCDIDRDSLEGQRNNVYRQHADLAERQGEIEADGQ